MDADDEINILFDLARNSFKNLSNIRSLPENWPQIRVESKLLSYAYFKQATKGACTVDEPDWWNATDRYKWSAWKKLGNMSERDSKLGYIKLAAEICQKYQSIGDKELEEYLGSVRPDIKRTDIENIFRQNQIYHEKLLFM